MTIKQKSQFKKAYKKLHDNQLPEVNAAIKDIATNLHIGDPKRGDLLGVFVHKFNVLTQLFLIVYEHDSESLTLLSLGVHENFYEKLKR